MTVFSCGAKAACKISVFAGILFLASALLPAAGQPSASAPAHKTETPALMMIENSFSDSEKAELQKLRSDNPEEFRKKVREKIQAIKEKKAPESAQISDLVEKYNKSASSEEKDNIRKQLRDISAKQFSARMRSNKDKIDLAEKRLADLKKEYEERMKKADDIIDKRVDDLTRDPTVRW